MTSMSCKLEPAIWPHDTGQQIPYFDRCQLIITWMSDIKEVPVNQGCMSVNLLLEYGCHVARLHRRRHRHRRRAYAPTNNTASHGTHEKINSWVPFSSLIWVWDSAWRPSATGAPLIPTKILLHRLQRKEGNSVPFTAVTTAITMTKGFLQVTIFSFPTDPKTRNRWCNLIKQQHGIVRQNGERIVGFVVKPPNLVQL